MSDQILLVLFAALFRLHYFSKFITSTQFIVLLIMICNVSRFYKRHLPFLHICVIVVDVDVITSVVMGLEL